MTVTHVDGFAESWAVTVLPAAPMIAPARQFVFPLAVAGEEDALARGALWLEVKPAQGGTFLAQCALGFAGSGVATGAWATPNPDDLLAVAGGYAYRIRTPDPAATELLPMRPVVGVFPVPAAKALVMVGFHQALVLTAESMWESPKLTWEGVTEVAVEGTHLCGKGWHMPSDREIPFRLDLLTRELSGGGFTP